MCNTHCICFTWPELFALLVVIIPCGVAIVSMLIVRRCS